MSNLYQNSKIREQSAPLLFSQHRNQNQSIASLPESCFAEVSLPEASPVERYNSSLYLSWPLRKSHVAHMDEWCYSEASPASRDASSRETCREFCTVRRLSWSLGMSCRGISSRGISRVERCLFKRDFQGVLHSELTLSKSNVRGDVTALCISLDLWERVMSHIWMSDVTHVKDSTYVNEPWISREMSFDFWERVMSHVWMSDVTHVNDITDVNEPWLVDSYEWERCQERCRWYETKEMSCIWVTRDIISMMCVAEMNETSFMCVAEMNETSFMCVAEMN